jgi:hypothetical protein
MARYCLLEKCTVMLAMHDTATCTYVGAAIREEKGGISIFTQDRMAGSVYAAAACMHYAYGEGML